MSFLKYIAIASVTIAAMSLLIHGGVLGEECISYEDGSSNCENFKVKKWNCETDGNKICGSDNKKSNNDNDNDNDNGNDNNNNNNDNDKGYVSDMYEDQLTVCNFESECVVINIDDYMSREKANQLETVFSHDLNTFSVSDLN